MSSLPIRAKLFLALIYLAGLGAPFAAEYLDPGYCLPAVSAEFVIFVALSMVAGRVKVTLIPHKRDKQDDDDIGSMSLGFALTFAALLRLGPAAAAIVGSAGALVGCLFPRRQPWHQLLFNISLSVLEATVGGLLFLHMNGGHLALRGMECFPAMVSSCLAFFLVNTGAVATIIALCSGQRIPSVWRESFLWTAPSYFAGAGVSTFAVLVLGDNVGASLLFCSPVFYLTFSSYRLYAGRAEEKQKHIEELQVSQEKLAVLYLSTVKSLALAIDAKDQYTHQHILRVQQYAVATAKEMGITGGELEGINTGALLHDIGKLGVPEYVLLKPGKLSDDEFDKVKKHPEIGAAILDPVEFPWPVLPAVKYHHEKWDGSGYPEGLCGEQIPLPGRILAVADVYDALTSNRSYRNALTHEDAIRRIREGAGSHFDPAVVEAFLRIIDGIVEEMAREGQGPLVLRPAVLDRSIISKSEEAAREIQRASSELWALYEVAQTLSSSLGLRETLDILARKLEAILPGTACLFLLKDEADPAAATPTVRLTERASVGINLSYFAGCSTLSAESCSLQVACEQRTYLGPYQMDDLMLTSSPSELWVELRSSLIVPIVHQGEVLGTINLYHPHQEAFSRHDQQLLEMIAERAAMALYNGILYDRTRSRASTDPLTGLYNVHYLTEHVKDRCGAAGSEPGNENGAPCEERQRFALLCLDLDSFKPINDLYGHQKGDVVLRDLSLLLRNMVKPTDVVARYGGDEFVIVLGEVDGAAAQNIADRLQKAVAGYDPHLTHETLGALRVGVSIGIACYPDDGEDCGTLLSVADARMYRGKAERKLEQMVERSARQSKHPATNEELAYLNGEGHSLFAAWEGRNASRREPDPITCDDESGEQTAFALVGGEPLS